MKYNIEKMKELRAIGKTYAEIADIIGCSEWTVKYWLMNSRKNLKKNILLKRKLKILFILRENDL